jgi:hypothetical protein
LLRFARNDKSALIGLFTSESKKKPTRFHRSPLII